jgi:hypothetical protein
LWNDIILEEIIMKPIITPASETPAVTRTVAARETEPEVEEEGQPAEEEQDEKDDNDDAVQDEEVEDDDEVHDEEVQVAEDDEEDDTEKEEWLQAVKEEYENMKEQGVFEVTQMCDVPKCAKVFGKYRDNNFRRCCACYVRQFIRPKMLPVG